MPNFYMTLKRKHGKPDGGLTRREMLQRSFAAALAENLGYRQLHAWWRLRGMYEELRGREAAWGTMVRRGFADAPETTTGSGSAPDVDARDEETSEVVGR